MSMRVLCNNSDVRYRNMTVGLGSVFGAAGHEFTLWNPEDKPAFDVFDDVEPDIYIGPQLKLGVKGGGIYKCLKERDGIHQAHLEYTDFAADTINYRRGEQVHEYTSDVVYVSGWDTAMHEDVFSTLYPEYQVKVCGFHQWDQPYYLGPIANETIPDFYASSKVCLSFDDEQVYQIFYSGGFPITSCQQFPSCSGVAVRKENYLNWLLITKQDEKKRSGLIEIGRGHVLRRHTYWHRVADMFRMWGMDKEGDRIIKAYNATQTV